MLSGSVFQVAKRSTWSSAKAGAGQGQDRGRKKRASGDGHRSSSLGQAGSAGLFWYLISASVAGSSLPGQRPPFGVEDMRVGGRDAQLHAVAGAGRMGAVGDGDDRAAGVEVDVQVVLGSQPFGQADGAGKLAGLGKLQPVGADAQGDGMRGVNRGVPGGGDGQAGAVP
jgi:hypothetical protein